MIKVILEIRVNNHEDILNQRNRFFGPIITKFVSIEEKVEEAICKDLAERIVPEVKQGLSEEGVLADVYVRAFIERRDRG
jgi:hypothetical protein